MQVLVLAHSLEMSAIEFIFLNILLRSSQKEIIALILENAIMAIAIKEPSLRLK